MVLGGHQLPFVSKRVAAGQTILTTISMSDRAESNSIPKGPFSLFLMEKTFIRVHCTQCICSRICRLQAGD
eukprot:jgi/Botrbrau1/17259/Bobra.0015s0018.1